MTTIPRPRLVSGSTDLAAEDIPEQVTIALRELAGAATSEARQTDENPPSDNGISQPSSEPPGPS